jgi:hypothetical protein
MSGATAVPEDTIAPPSDPAPSKPNAMTEAERNRIREMLVATSKTAELIAELPQKTEDALSKMINSANSYVSKVLTIGYASFFAIWAMTRTLMTPMEVFSTALLMLISVAIFVANEIYNISMLNRCARALAVNDPLKTHDALGAKMAEIADRLRGINLATTRYRGIQMGALVAAMATACAAAVVMVYALVSGLWSALH